MGRSVEKLKALILQRLSKQPGLHGDGGGLSLRVSSPTVRSWVFRYMLAGKAHEMGLGSYPDISLAEARVMAAEARNLKAQGKDPIAERESVRAAKRIEEARSVTFRQCAAAYISAKKDGWKNKKHGSQWHATLDTYAMPLIGDLPVQSVDVAMVHKVLEPIWSEKRETASRLRGRIEAILDWAKTRGYREGENPARWKGHLEILFPSRSNAQRVRHHAALPYTEISSFMARLEAEKGTSPLALRFAILTAARTSEVIGVCWSEMDLANAVWTVPADRMKSGRNHRVPLAKECLEILRKRHQETNGKGFVFENPASKKPISNMAILKTLHRMGRTDLTVHGFRSTFRDWAAECTGYPSEVAEAALAHVVGDQVEAAYRRGDLFDKRRKLMNAWAGFCASSANETKIVPMRKAAS